MPQGGSKIIKRRIKSVSNTGKITKAMELVAASKMQRAVNSVLSTRPYSMLAWNTINAISRAAGEVSHPLLNKNIDAEKTLIIVFSSDRGLAGPFNTNIVRETAKAVGEINGEKEAIAVGKRGNAALRRLGVPVIASFEGLTNKPTFSDILPIGKMIIQEYIKGTYKSVEIVYTDFVSALTQKPRSMTLLPLGKNVDSKLGSVQGTEDSNQEFDHAKPGIEYKFEPSPQNVLERVLPRLAETMIYQALLESAASEHSARMIAMRNASENAEEMMNELTLMYNQIRQAGITQEIAEISIGAAAIK